MQKTRLIETEAVEGFEYGKNNDRYWDGAKLYIFFFFFSLSYFMSICNPLGYDRRAL